MTETTAPQKLKLYDRLKLATQHRLAEPILALMCFLEAMILPIFPEIMILLPARNPGVSNGSHLSYPLLLDNTGRTISGRKGYASSAVC